MLTKRARMDESSRPGAINVQDARFTRCTVQKKRRISRRKRLDKLTSAGTNNYLLRCWALNQYANATGGWFVLGNTNQTLAADLGHYLPIWYFDVTAAMNWSSQPNGTTGLAFGQVSYRPFIRTDATQAASAGGITFRKNVSQFETPSGTGTGGNANTLYYTGQTGSSTQNGFIRAALHKYMSARMLCYGIGNVPVRFRVSLIRFKRAHLCPGWQDVDFDNGDGATNGASGSFDENVMQSIALQQYLAGPFRHSPLNIQQTWARKLYQEKVIKDFVIGGAPVPVAPATFTPYMHQLDIFQTFNAIRRYDWSNNTSAQSDRAWNTNNYDQVVTPCQTNVDFTKRWYLVVRAQALEGTQATDIAPAPDTTRYPSFDFNMINKYQDII